MDQAINDNNVHGFYSLDKEFHLAISEASRNRVLFDMSRMLWEQRINIPYAGLDEQSGDRNVLLNLNKQHKAIVDAMRQSDADSAYEGSLEHLRYVKDCRRLSLSMNNTAWRSCHAVELAVNQWKTALIFK